MAIPIADKQGNVTVFDSTPVTGAQTPLTANWKAGTIFSCGNARVCALSMKYDADASGTANRPQVIVCGSNKAGTTAPVIADDEWFPLTREDATPTDGVIAGTFPTNFDATVQPEWGVVKMRGLVFELFPSDAGSDKYRMMVFVNVAHIRWLVVLAKELGDQDAGDVGVLVVEASLSA